MILLHLSAVLVLLGGGLVSANSMFTFLWPFAGGVWRAGWWQPDVTYLLTSTVLLSPVWEEKVGVPSRSMQSCTERQSDQS